MGKKTNLNTDVFEVPSAHLRELSWKLQGLGHLIANTEPDAVPSKKESYGIGQILIEIGRELEEMSTMLEGTSDKKGSHESS